LFASFFLPFSLQAIDKSWVESANNPATDFPLQNLPYGIFKYKTGLPRVGVRIGDFVLDLRKALKKELLGELSKETINALQKTNLNALINLSEKDLSNLRSTIYELLKIENTSLKENQKLQTFILAPLDKIEVLLPVQIGDYTDFYASIHHATHVGSLMRPENPLMPNYKHLPIGYHGRSSSVIVSGVSINWPSGQVLNKEGIPEWSLSRSLDYELEMGAIIGRGNALGEPIKISDAKDHIFGFVLLNDWSARDVQKWEYQPLGPFNGKNFASTVSPWIVTKEALKPFLINHQERAPDDPPLLKYLTAKNLKTYDVQVEAYLLSEKMQKDNLEPFLIAKGHLKDLYWTFDQMVCHHTVGGCNLRSGDLLGSGTISGETAESLGCLLERAALKLDSLSLPDGTKRTYLESGDEIILKAYAEKDNYPRIGFGECRAKVIKR
jgi:fumarylacetoacetase